MSTFSTRQANAFRKAFRLMSRHPMASFMNVLSLALALMLPLAGYVLLYNVKHLDTLIDYKPTITLYLLPNITAQQLNDTGVLIQRISGIQHFKIIEKDHVSEQLKQDSDIRELLDSLPDNPFPDTIVVIPRNTQPAHLSALKTELSAIKQVEKVIVDDVWASRLNGAIKFGQLIVAGITGLLFLMMMVMSIAIGRIEVLRDTPEMSLAYLLGGTPSAIRRPYTYFGGLLGIGSALMALLLVFGGLQLLIPETHSLARLYESEFTLRFIPFAHMGIFLLASCLLGALGSWLAARAFPFKD